MDAASREKVASRKRVGRSKPFSGWPHPTDMLDTTMPAPPAANDVVDETALVRAAAAGDTAAYEQLYRQHAPRVFATLWRLCGGQQARAVKEAGYGLFCYTVNDAGRARELLAWGVDAFCTDRIDLIHPDFA